MSVMLALPAVWFRPAAADEGDTEALAVALRKVMDENLAACERQQDSKPELPQPAQTP